MRLRRCLPLGAMLALLAWPALAQDYPNTQNFGGAPDRQARWYQICMRVHHAAPKLPAAPASRCDADSLYYTKLDQAVTSAAEWAAVRRCASATGDTTVLSMLYANGLGVRRDPDVATHYACSAGGAPAELEGRVLHLATLAAGARYDQCDDITSGMMGGVCSAMRAARAGRVEAASVARLRASLPVMQGRALDRLVKANAAFATVHGDMETPRGGTGYNGFVVDARARETEWLREHLAAFEKGVFKVPPPAQYAVDDAELNRLYGERMQPLSSDADIDTISATDIRTTQRAWLAYRDAWLAFAALRYPQLPADSLKALLTQWRLRQLARD